MRLVAVVDGDEPGLLPADLPVHAGDRRATGWGKYQFFVFLATTLFVNSLVQAFFMPNGEEFSELIRTGGLDFALLKPIDTQFLVSLQKIDWSSLANFVFAVGLLVLRAGAAATRARRSCRSCSIRSTWLCGVAIMYSLMIALAATSVWLGRNQTLYDFWFYITNFSRYPMEIYQGADRHAAATGSSRSSFRCWWW